LHRQANGLALLEVATLPRGASVQGAVAALAADPAVAFAEPNWRYTHGPIAATALPGDRGFNNNDLWGMYGNTVVPGCDLGKSCTNPYGSRAADAWAQGAMGSASVYVGVIDEGLRWDHPDLKNNVWTNPGESGSYQVLNPDGTAVLNPDGMPKMQDRATDGIDNDGDGRVDDEHGWDFANKDGSVYDGSTRVGDNLPGVDNHGTHVSGTIGAQANNYTFNDGGTCPADATINRPLNQCGGLTGVNWNVQLISGKFLGPNGGVLSDAVLAVDYMTYLKAGCKALQGGVCPKVDMNPTGPGLNIVALNNSWGGGGYAQSLHDAIIRAAKVDILFIAAAGNDGRNTERRPSYPSAYSTLKGTSTQPAASYDSVIAVAAIDSAGNLASFSNWAATAVDLGAPGVGIWSTTGTPNAYTNTPYDNYSGTSMATPHVTGGAALYAADWAAKNGGRAPAVQIKNALLDSAKNTPTASLYSKTATGGRLNIDLALTTPVRLK